MQRDGGKAKHLKTHARRQQRSSSSSSSSSGGGGASTQAAPSRSGSRPPSSASSANALYARRCSTHSIPSATRVSLAPPLSPPQHGSPSPPLSLLLLPLPVSRRCHPRYRGASCVALPRCVLLSITRLFVLLVSLSPPPSGAGSGSVCGGVGVGVGAGGVGVGAGIAQAWLRYFRT